MKHYFGWGISLLTLFFCFQPVWGQEVDWTPHSLDSLLLIYHPATVVEKTSNDGGVFLHQAISYVGTASFISQRIWLDPRNNEKDFSEVIYDEEQLEYFYRKILDGYIETNSFEVVFKKLEDQDGLLASHFRMADSTQRHVSEGYIYLMGMLASLFGVFPILRQIESNDHQDSQLDHFPLPVSICGRMCIKHA